MISEDRFEVELKEFLRDLGNKYRSTYKEGGVMSDCIFRRSVSDSDKNRLEFKAVISYVNPKLK